MNGNAHPMARGALCTIGAGWFPKQPGPALPQTCGKGAAGQQAGAARVSVVGRAVLVKQSDAQLLLALGKYAKSQFL
jgi:hypothetical protein